MQALASALCAGLEEATRMQAACSECRTHWILVCPHSQGFFHGRCGTCHGGRAGARSGCPGRRQGSGTLSSRKVMLPRSSWAAAVSASCLRSSAALRSPAAPCAPRLKFGENWVDQRTP